MFVPAMVASLVASGERGFALEATLSGEMEGRGVEARRSGERELSKSAGSSV